MEAALRARFAAPHNALGATAVAKVNATSESAKQLGKVVLAAGWDLEAAEAVESSQVEAVQCHYDCANARLQQEAGLLQQLQEELGRGLGPDLFAAVGVGGGGVYGEL